MPGIATAPQSGQAGRRKHAEEALPAYEEPSHAAWHGSEQQQELSSQVNALCTRLGSAGAQPESLWRALLKQAATLRSIAARQEQQVRELHEQHEAKAAAKATAAAAEAAAKLAAAQAGATTNQNEDLAGAPPPAAPPAEQQAEQQQPQEQQQQEEKPTKGVHGLAGEELLTVVFSVADMLGKEEARGLSACAGTSVTQVQQLFSRLRTSLRSTVQRMQSRAVRDTSPQDDQGEASVSNARPTRIAPAAARACRRAGCPPCTWHAEHAATRTPLAPPQRREAAGSRATATAAAQRQQRQAPAPAPAPLCTPPTATTRTPTSCTTTTAAAATARHWARRPPPGRAAAPPRPPRTRAWTTRQRWRPTRWRCCSPCSWRTGRSTWRPPEPWPLSSSCRRVRLWRSLDACPFLERSPYGARACVDGGAPFASATRALMKRRVSSSVRGGAVLLPQDACCFEVREAQLGTLSRTSPYALAPLMTGPLLDLLAAWLGDGEGSKQHTFVR